MTHMEQDQRINIVLLDACRNNPLVDDLARSMGTRSASLGRGLARIETGVGTYVGFSTQPGNVALDGEGAHSPFAEALVKNIELPDLDIETLMRQVRAEVIVATNGRQVPWGNSSLVGRGFVFKATATPATGKELDQGHEQSSPARGIPQRVSKRALRQACRHPSQSGQGRGARSAAGYWREARGGRGAEASRRRPEPGGRPAD
jgi:uncharacterized caspase-like protein